VATAGSRVSRQDTFEEACRRADEKRRRQVEPGRLAQLRRLLDDNVSLERTRAELNQQRRDCAAPATVEALTFSLRSRGVQALSEPATQRRLSELNDAQLREVALSLRKLKPEIARAWTPKEVEVLIAATRRLKNA
jgi:hypothetical protein